MLLLLATSLQKMKVILNKQKRTKEAIKKYTRKSTKHSSNTAIDTTAPPTVAVHFGHICQWVLKTPASRTKVSNVTSFKESVVPRT